MLLLINLLELKKIFVFTIVKEISNFMLSLRRCVQHMTEFDIR